MSNKRSYEDIMKKDNMKNIVEEYSLQELEEMLVAKQTIAKSLIPLPLQNPDYSKLRTLAESIIKDMAGDDYCEDNDNTQWAYEAMMNAVYGPGVWEWINKRLV